MIYTSGQIPIDPVTGELVPGGAVEQCHQVLKNLKAIIKAGGSRMEDVVKTTVYVTDLEEYVTINEVYSQYFRGDHLPARSFVQVAALPKGALVEIDAVASI